MLSLTSITTYVRLARFVNVMEEKQCERGIMLYRKKLTPSAKKVSFVSISTIRDPMFLPIISLSVLFLRPPRSLGCLCLFTLSSHPYAPTCVSRRAYRRPCTSQTIQELQGDYKIEEYAEADLVVNITKHFLVPKHTIMTAEEKKELLQR